MTVEKRTNIGVFFPLAEKMDARVSCEKSP
jgi:hypothetical protein